MFTKTFRSFFWTYKYRATLSYCVKRIPYDDIQVNDLMSFYQNLAQTDEW